MTFEAPVGAKPRRDDILHAGCTPIYLQDWWWDIASSGRQKLVAVYEDGRELGRLLYFPRTRSSLRFCQLPEGVHAPWTQYCAPTINEGPEGPGAARRGEIAYKLAYKLPHNISYHLTCPHYIDAAILSAFARAGFQIGTQRSFIFDARGAKTADILARLDMSTRQRYRKAEKKLDIVEIAPSKFFDLYRRDLAARAKTSYHDLDVAERLATTCRARGTGCIRITAAKGKDTADCDDHSYYAAIACLQDEAFSYYWMSTRAANVIDPAIKNGAIKFLLVDAIEHASQAGLIFDFDGAASEGSGELYRGFRGTEANRYVLTRKTLSARLVQAVRAVVSTAFAKAGVRNERLVSKVKSVRSVASNLGAAAFSLIEIAF
jgi:hypothetical protein